MEKYEDLLKSCEEGTAWRLEQLFISKGDKEAQVQLYISELEYAMNPRPGHWIPDFVEGEHKTMLSILKVLFQSGEYDRAISEYTNYKKLNQECDSYAFRDYDEKMLDKAENELRVFLSKLSKDVLGV